MNNLRAFEEFNNVDPYGEEKWNDVKEETLDGVFSVISQHYEGYAPTLVIADSKEEAFQKYNDWVDTEPHGIYTPRQCEDIDHVFEAKALK
jgi:hypothetical protein